MIRVLLAEDQAMVRGALAALLSLALTGVIALDQFVPTNPWTGTLKGRALVFLWDRQSTLSCTGNAVMVVEGVDVQRTFAPLFEARASSEGFQRSTDMLEYLVRPYVL